MRDVRTTALSVALVAASAWVFGDIVSRIWWGGRDRPVAQTAAVGSSETNGDCRQMDASLDALDSLEPGALLPPLHPPAHDTAPAADDLAGRGGPTLTPAPWNDGRSPAPWSAPSTASRPAAFPTAASRLGSEESVAESASARRLPWADVAPRWPVSAPADRSHDDAALSGADRELHSDLASGPAGADVSQPVARRTVDPYGAAQVFRSAASPLAASRSADDAPPLTAPGNHPRAAESVASTSRRAAAADSDVVESSAATDNAGEARPPLHVAGTSSENGTPRPARYLETGLPTFREAPERLLESLRARPLTANESQAARQSAQRSESRARQVLATGFDAAERGAAFTAKERFTDVLRMVAQAADIGCGRPYHTHRLTSGLRALKEADDFRRLNEWLDGDFDPSSVIQHHRSGVITMDEARRLTVVEVQRRYLEFAQAQLAASAASSSAGSVALYGLGKFHTGLSQLSPGAGQRHIPYALVMHQAALLADPGNSRAGNEVGVLLARLGKLEEAKQTLQQSLASHRSADVWHNLACVHEQLGEASLAAQARWEQAQLQTGASETLDGRSLRWVDPATFSRIGESNEKMELAAEWSERSFPASQQSQPAAAVAAERSTPGWRY